MRTRPALALGFGALLGVMAFHELEHLVQLLQKDALGASCPNDCRGLLGFAFDLEWIHFTYNASIEVGLIAVAAALRIWRGPRTFGWAMLSTAVLLQGYHVVEHTQKLVQWFEGGQREGTPGILGNHVSLVELHFGLNTFVFGLVVAAFLGYGFHRQLRVLLGTPGRLVAVGAAVVLLIFASVAAWSQRPPTVHLAAGVHEGPLTIDRPMRLVGERGAVVRGGIVIRSDDVVVRDLAVEGGENGIVVEGAEEVVLERVTVEGARLDGIHVRRASVAIRDCEIRSQGQYTQGIDISFAFDLAPSVVEGCTVAGGLEGIVSHFARVDFRDNDVRGSTLRGITVTEMSMGSVKENAVSDSLGVGIFCGDYSQCTISRNTVVGTRPDEASGDRTRAGFGVLAHFWATATVTDNTVLESPGGVAAVLDATVVDE